MAKAAFKASSVPILRRISRMTRPSWGAQGARPIYQAGICREHNILGLDRGVDNHLAKSAGLAARVRVATAGLS